MDQRKKQARREPPEGFWKTAKGRALAQEREQQAERDTWRHFSNWR